MSDDGKMPVVMIVEDHPLIRMTGVDIFEDAGYEVVEAESADDAIAILEGSSDVRLMFSDVDMPGCMDGVALAEFVHARWPDIRLIITSGHHQIADADLPDDGRFVPKPYSSGAVVAQAKDLLDES